MDILLISPYCGDPKNNFPWGILSLGSYLTTIKNYRVQLLEINAYSKSNLISKLKDFCKKTKLVGISMMSMDVYSAKSLIDYIKEIAPNIKIVVGGPHAMLLPEQTCLYKNIDFVAYTEGEETLSLLIKEVNSGNNAYYKIPGLIYKEQGMTKKTRPPKPTEFFDISYGLLRESAHRNFHEYIQVLAGRGCSYRCTFCFNSVCGQKWRPRPIKDIVLEIEKILDKYNSRVIYFRDDNFFQSKERIFDFIKYYREKKFSFQWRANCRVSYFNKNYLTPEILQELEEINCQVLKFGLESGSQRVLDFLKKGANLEQTRRIIRTLGKFKRLKAIYSFIIGLPTETPREYIETLKLIGFIRRHDHRATIVGPQYFRIYPGGELYEEIVKKYGYREPDSFEGWVLKHAPDNDPYGTSQNTRYSWILPKYSFLTQQAHQLVLLACQNIKRYLNHRLIIHVPFIILAKIRLRYALYGFLYDLRLILILKTLKKKFLTTKADMVFME